MIPTILHLYGPLSIQSYGLTICLGIAVGVFAAARHPWAQGISQEQLFDLVAYVICVGIIGGRLLHIVTEPDQYVSKLHWLMLWEGGFSILGTVVGIAIFIPWYCRRLGLPLFPLFDLFALYAPLVQSISRVGCFLAGCCGGSVTTMPWGIVCESGKGPVHPTQLYSVALLMLIFIVLRWIIAPRFRRQGQVLAWYFMLMGSERFFVDWWRADRLMMTDSALLSVHQYGALECLLFGALMLAMTICLKQKPYEHF